MVRKSYRFLAERHLTDSDQTAVILALKSLFSLVKLESWKSAKDILNQLFALICSPTDPNVLKGNEALKLAVIQCSIACLSASELQNLYSEDFFPEFGHKVFVLLHICTEEKSWELKSCALDALLLMTSGTGPEAEATVCSVLPGVAMGTVQICNNPTQPHEVTVKSVQLFMRVLPCLREALSPRKSDLLVDQTEKWLKETSENVCKLAQTLCTRLISSQIPHVRLILLDLAGKILSHPSLNPAQSAALDVTVTLVNDGFPQVRAKAEQVIENVKISQNWPKCVEKLLESLYQLCTRLPTTVRNGSDEMAELALGQMGGLVGALGEEGGKRLCRCEGQLRRLTLAMCQTIEFDVQKLSGGVRTVQSEESRAEWTPLPLKFLRSSSPIENIIAILSNSANPQFLIDHLMDLIQESLHECQSIYLLAILLECYARADSSHVPTSVLQDVLSSCLVRLNDINLDLTPSDAQVMDLDRDYSKESVMCCVLLRAVTALVTVLGPDSLQEALYPILALTNTSQYVVRECADCALVKLSTSCKRANVSELLLTHADYLVFNLEIKLRHFELNPRSPLVLKSLLERCKNARMYAHTKHMVQEMLLALDSNHRVLLSFTEAIRTWFSSQETTEKPEHIKQVVSILERTKHLASTEHLPLRLIVMDLICAALRAVKDYENELLPMVHQNWAPVCKRFRDENKVVAAKAFQVVCVMSDLSSDFILHRVVTQLWPFMRDFLLHQSSRSIRTAAVYRQSAACRLQEALLNGLPQLFENIKAPEDILKTVIEVCEIYCSPEQPKILSSAASEALSRLAILIESR